ncbi:MAG TPA: hypothetical protein VLB04_01985 [Methanotrichaceae archaeon]|nr:hypothetical protein [Methanotrichaceae archaeon]
MRNRLICTALLLAALIFSANAASWSGGVITDSDSWYIYRESSNLSFNFEQSVQGQISPVDFRGRSLSPFHSFYENVKLNDVKVKERTAALEGSLSIEELLTLKSSINNSVNATWYKPAGSDLWTIDFYEKWPVKLCYSKTMAYSGKNINNRDFVGNNQDFVGANFLYNKEFSKERSINASLERLNATILATDESLQNVLVKATRSTEYKLKAHTTGIANIKYRQVGPDDEIMNAGDERFVGVYDIEKKIQMKSKFDLYLEEDGWLPCCYGGWSDMNYRDQKGFGKSAKGVFDCSCYRVPAQA